MAALGPVELLFVEFPGNQFTGEIIPALSELIDQGTIRMLEPLIAEEDVEDLAEALEPNSSAAILLFEHTWAIPFRDAVAGSGGRLVARLPITEEALAEIADAG